jgi:hypothetical protein
MGARHYLSGDYTRPETYQKLHEALANTQHPLHITSADGWYYPALAAFEEEQMRG